MDALEYLTAAGPAPHGAGLFDFRDNDELADFCLGRGAFTAEAYLNHPALRFHGVEVNASAAEVASIRLETLGCPIDAGFLDVCPAVPSKRLCGFHATPTIYLFPPRRFGRHGALSRENEKRRGKTAQAFTGCSYVFESIARRSC